MADITKTNPIQRYDYTNNIFNNFPSKNVIGPNLIAKSSLVLNNHDKNNNNSSNKIAIAACAIGCGMLFLSKGVQRHTKKTLEKVRNTLEGKLDTSMLEEANKKTSFYEYTIRKLNSFLLKTESINNINSLKDILFMKTMYKTEFTKKIHKGISGAFEKLSINTVRNSYKRTRKNFNDMYKAFDDLDNYLLKTSGEEIVEYKNKKLPKKEFIKRAKYFRENVQIVADTFMSDEAQDSRYKCINDATSELYSKFWNESFRGFWTKDNKFKRKEMWQTFIAAEQVKDNKTTLAENVSVARTMLSFTNEEKSIFLGGYLKNLNAIIPPNDAEGANIIKQLRWFVTDTKALKDNKDIFLKELEKLEKHNIVGDKKLQKDKDTNIRLIRNMITDEATGELQDMLDIYYRIAPFELAKSGALKSAQKAVSSFDKSVHLEIGDFFDKSRDLKLGSAPTDILTILMSCGMITYGLDKAKGKDEKTSVALKSGIPLIGAVATSLISATKLVSGAKSIALGLASGLFLNQAGSFADKYRKTKTVKNLQSKKSS